MCARGGVDVRGVESGVESREVIGLQHDSVDDEGIDVLVSIETSVSLIVELT